MASGENLGTSFTIDVTDLKAGLAQANRLIRESESEFRAAAAGMDDWSSSQEGLEARTQTLNKQVDLQQQKVDALVQAKQDLIDKLTEEGKSHEEIVRATDAVNKSITSESKQLDKLKSDLGKTEKALDSMSDSSDDAGDSMDDAGDSADDAADSTDALADSADDAADSAENLADKTDDAGEKFKGLKAAGAIAGKAVAAVAAAAAACVTAFFGLAESTRESRTAMAKLETQFTTAGLSAEDATSTFTELYGVLGDEGKASEASAFLAQMADNEQDLSEMTNALTGVYATFGNSLPVEGLAEAMNHTAELGTVQGNLADALEWSGISVDEFNAQLAACSSEQERQDLIVSTLNETYGKAAETYKEVNADVIAAQEAQAGMTQALNNLGAIAEPIMTTLKQLATELLVAITPFVQLIGEGLKGAFEGTAGAGELLAQGIGGIIDTVLNKALEILPTVIDMILALVPQLITSLLAKVPEIIQFLVDVVAQVLSTLSTVLPQILTQIVELIPQIINQLIASIPQLLEAAIQFLMAIVQAIPTIITSLLHSLPSILNTIVTTLTNAIPMLLQAAKTLLMTIVQAIPTIIQSLIAALPGILNAILTYYTQTLPQVLQAAIEVLMTIVEAIPTIIQALLPALPSIINTITTTLVQNIPALLNAAVTMFMAIVKAIPQIIAALVPQLPTIISAIVDGLMQGVSAMGTVGLELIKGLWNGISDAASWLWEKVKGWCNDLIDGIKGFFGIHSPSKLFADEIGKNLALGVGVGWSDSIGGVADQMSESLNGAIPDVNVDGGDGTSAGSVGGVTVYQTNNYSQAHSRYELYKSKQQTAAAVQLALGV